ncbi:hypothetical protein LTR53_001153 [Teratosphaeriaceae sp. CCFEE 6253]|nr:hypothetical protein LTR53_001153 [Teratosphaeriaceae sp. CCFEE 6253]
MRYQLAVAVVALVSAAGASLYGESDQNHTCILYPDYLSCSKEANPATVDSCCVETYGGLLLQTQYWDTYTGLEAEGQLLPGYSWTIHGLWPDFCNGSYTQYCDLARQYDPVPSPNTTSGLPNGTAVEPYTGPNIGTFLEPFGKFDLLAYMNKYWISSGSPNYDFWGHEFSKHATCFSTFDVPCYGPEYREHEDVVDFFQTVIKYFMRLPTWGWLGAHGIYPSNSTTYTLGDMEAALSHEYGAVPYLGCSGPRYNTTAAGANSTDSGRTVLSEVWYYFHAYGRPQDGACIFGSAGKGTLTGQTRTRPTSTRARDVRTTSNRIHGGVQQSARLPVIRLERRYASNGSLASTTAINAPTTVPEAYRDLHQRLLVLQHEAGNYVNLSRLQLAARSLERESPVVRVALLGLGTNGAQAARKLARVLLSDALGEEQAWEQELVDSGRDGKSLLLKYGDGEEIVPQSPLVQTLHIPSLFLKRHNVEILVTGLNANSSSGRVSDAELEEAILVPSLTTPNSEHGRVGYVRYPVHKALIVAEGVTGAVQYGRLPRFLDKAELIKAALSLPLRASTGIETPEAAANDNRVDIDLATHALQIFRSSNANGARFSEEWQTSRLPGLSHWIASPQQEETPELPQAVRSLLNSVLLNASATIERTETDQTAITTQATISNTKRAEVDALITHFAADWHRDLQMNLTAALDSRSWRRTAWWRLLWRIDDVSVAAADILHRSWLTEAEQTLAFLSGRINEADLATADELREAGPVEHHAVEGVEDVAFSMTKWQPVRAQAIPFRRGLQAADLFQEPALVARVKEQSGVNAAFNPPWPRTIQVARQQMLHTLVPDLHRRAQTLLLATLSTAGGASALGGWIHLATGGSAAQTGGAIAALGIVWSLRRLQMKWGTERAAFATTVQENGRRVLADVERHLRRLVREGGRASVRPEDIQSWQEARVAVAACRQALEQVK